MTEKKNKSVKDSLEALKVYATKLVEGKIPKEVLAAHTKWGEWVRESSSVYFEGAGIERYESCSLTKALPTQRNNDRFQLTVAEAEKYTKLKRVWQNEKKEYDKLKIDVEAAVFGARTYNRIGELFPEAVPFLPVSYAVPAINYPEIRKKIK